MPASFALKKTVAVSSRLQRRAQPRAASISTVWARKGSRPRRSGAPLLAGTAVTIAVASAASCGWPECTEPSQ